MHRPTMRVFSLIGAFLALSGCAPEAEGDTDTGAAAPCEDILAACPYADARADAEIGGCGVVAAELRQDDGAHLALPVQIGRGWIEWSCPAAGVVVVSLGGR